MTGAGAAGPVPGSLGAAALPQLSGHAAIVVTSSTPLWYITRATGLVALVLLTIGMALGLLIAVRLEGRQWPRFITIGLHRKSGLGFHRHIPALQIRHRGVGAEVAKH